MIGTLRLPIILAVFAGTIFFFASGGNYWFATFGLVAGAIAGYLERRQQWKDEQWWNERMKR